MKVTFDQEKMEVAMKRYIVGVLLGAVVAFAWSTVSWIILPWHNLDIRSFKDPAVVEEAIRGEALMDGIYMIPNLSDEIHDDAEKRKQWQQEAEEGPFSYMSIRVDGTRYSMGVSMIVQFISLLLVALIAVWLITRSSLTKLWQRALFISAAVVAGAIVSHVPNWNWWGFPVILTLVNIVDTAVTWFLAGLVMASVLKS